jgi:hypothetical protein
MPMKASLSCLILLVTILGPWTSSAENLNPPLLPDQYGKPIDFAEYDGKPVLVIVADTRKLRWIGNWEKKLRKQLPELVSYRVAGVLDTPTPEYDQVAKVLRRWVPKNVPISIDINNHWATFYKLDINEACLILLDTDRQIIAQWRGRPKRALLTEVVAALQPYFPKTTEIDEAS